MNEMNQNLPPELRSALDGFYATLQPDPVFAERLEAQLHQRQIELMAAVATNTSLKQKSGPLRPTKGNSFMHLLRTHPIWAVIAVLLALFLLTGIAYAAGRLSGFIPGIGFVNNVQSILETPMVVTREMVMTPNSLLVEKGNATQVIQTLTTEPAKTIEQSLSLTSLPVQEKKGITISVEQVVAEADRLVIAYKITGYPANFFGPERVPTLQAFSEAHPDDPMQEQVLLPDGTFLDHANGGSCVGGGDLATSWLACQSLYAPLPSGVNQFTLQMHRLPNAIPDELPEDWIFLLQLTSVGSSQAASGVEELNLASQPFAGITLRLLKVDRTSVQTAFQLGLEWEGQNRMLDHIDLNLQDDQGRTYSLTSGQEGDYWSPDYPNRITFASKVADLVDNKRPLTFRLNSVLMTSSDQVTLHFDPGTDAKLGQEWLMDQTIQAGGFALHFIRARLIKDQDGSPTLEFEVQAPSDILAIPLFAEGSLSSSSEFDQVRGVWVSGVSFPVLPTRPLDLTISRIQYQVNGPWEITWQP